MPVEVFCSNCGKSIIKKPSRLKRSKEHFCCCECKAKFQEGKPTWNKGVKCPPLSKEHRQKISIKTKEALASPEVRQKLRDARAKLIITNETKKKLSKSLSGKHNPMFGRTGNKNPNWKGGVSYWRKQHYQEPKYKKWHAAVLKRDIYECKMCGQKKTVKGILHVHHIRSFAKYPKIRHDLENGIVLCKSCHQFIHSKKAGLGKIKSVEKFQEKINMIDIEVKDNNNFFANDVLVHNSGTVKRDDGNEMILESVIGPIIYKISAEELIKHGHLVPPDITFFKQPYEDAEGTYAEVYTEMIVKGIERNHQILSLVDNTKKTLVLVNRIEHGTDLTKAMQNAGHEVRFIFGSLSKECREQFFEWFKNTPGAILVGTASIFAEGINVPDLEVLINAAGNKGEVKTIQGLGRGLRTSAGKTSCIYYDFLDECTYLKEAAVSRMDTLRAEGYEVKIK